MSRNASRALLTPATALLVFGAIFFRPPAAHAAYQLWDSWAEGAITNNNIGFVAPTFDTTTMTYFASNYMNDTVKVPIISDPKSQAATIGTPITGEFDWVTAPQNTGNNISSADIAVTFKVSDDGGMTFKSVTAYANYYADAKHSLDDMQWSATPAGTPAYVPPASGTNYVTSVTLGDGSVVQVTFDYETDWNMAQQIDFDVMSGPTAVATPEPASFALLGLGFAAMLYARRKTV